MDDKLLDMSKDMDINPSVLMPQAQASTRYKVEVTDTYGGEANYSWVRRHVIVVPEGTLSERSVDRQARIVRAAKAAQGWTGHKCDTCMIGETIEVKPRGTPVVMFIDYLEDDS